MIRCSKVRQSIVVIIFLQALSSKSNNKKLRARFKAERRCELNSIFNRELFRGFIFNVACDISNNKVNHAIDGSLMILMFHT
jgi:hypothetical protein